MVVSGQQAFQIGEDSYRKRRLVEIKLEDGSVGYKTVGLLSETENKARTVRKYDSNHALKMSGIKKLIPAKLEAFEEWWDCFFDMYMSGASTDDPVFWTIQVVDGKEIIKRAYRKFEEEPGRDTYIVPHK